MKRLPNGKTNTTKNDNTPGRVLDALHGPERTFLGRMLQDMFARDQPPSLNRVFQHLKRNSGNFIRKVEKKGERILLRLKQAGERKTRKVWLTLSHFAELVRSLAEAAAESVAAVAPAKVRTARA